MTDEREVKTETDWLGNEKKVIYENGREIGEIKSEERGGLFGIGAEKVVVEYIDQQEISYTKKEESGGFIGIGSEEIDVTYGSKDNNVVMTSKVEERGGFVGLDTHHVRVGYDSKGNDISQTSHEKRGGLFGVGGDNVQVTKYLNKRKTVTHGGHHSKYTSPTVSFSSARSQKKSSTATSSISSFSIILLSPIAIFFLVSYTGQLLQMLGNNLREMPESGLPFIELLFSIIVTMLGLFIWLVGFIISLPLYFLEDIVGICISFVPGPGSPCG